MTKKEMQQIAAMVAATLAEQGSGTTDETPEERASRKVVADREKIGRRSTRSGQRKPQPRASAARKPQGDAPVVWIVRKSWKGQEARPRMIAAALHYGCSAASLEGLDKYEVSRAIAKVRGLKVKVEA